MPENLRSTKKYIVILQNIYYIGYDKVIYNSFKKMVYIYIGNLST